MRRRSLLAMVGALGGCSLLPSAPYVQRRDWPLDVRRPSTATPRQNGRVLLVRNIRAGPGLDERGLQWLPRDGKHVPEFAYGFNLVTRLGLIPRNDLLFLTFLMRPGDPYYGQHSYFAPFRALLVYRITLSL